jgi:hypothetical protein
VDAAPADDDVVADDDTSAADDDTTAGDDDTTPIGGPVDCGPSPDLGGDGVRYTGDARLEMSYSDIAAAFRGGAFTATWEGCEAAHRIALGVEECGVRYDATGQSYAEQLQESAIIIRLHIDFVATEDTCGDPALPPAREVFFRVRVPFDGPAAEILWSEHGEAVPSQMENWAEAPYNGDGEAPEEVVLLYQTALDP